MSDLRSRRDAALEAYKAEALELCAELEDALLELEESPKDMDLVGRVFRAMHTIKGSGSMFGLDDISEFTHEVETVYDHVRNGTVRVSKELIDMTLMARDWILETVNTIGSDDPADGHRSEELASSFKKFLPEAAGCDSVSENLEYSDNKGVDKALLPPEKMKTYRIRFKPNPEIFLYGTDPAYLIEDLREFGHCRVVAHTKNIPEIEGCNPERCYVSWDIILTTERGMDEIRDVFIFVESAMELAIDIIGEEGLDHEEQDSRRLGEILIERGDISTDELERALKERKRIGETLVSSGAIEQHQVDSALAEQEEVRNVNKRKKEKQEQQTIRVSSEKLYSLVNLVGELVTLQARLTQSTQGWSDFDLVSKNSDLLAELKQNNFRRLLDIASISEEVERITGEIRESAMSMQMVPIGSVFGKFRRLVRDLSSELGRDIRLITEGAETELDKTMIDKLGDPLVHIIRNCVDHGIEPPETRKSAGKPGQGSVHLLAEHSGGNILIRIRDDGKGMDTEAILSRAIEKGLITQDDELSEKDVLMLTFMPGFSTAGTVNGVSGRGVGMDVVKRSIDSLRGSVEIESEMNRGTTITLRIPLTLAIIDGLLVRVGAEHFVLPLLSVDECVEINGRDMHLAHGRRIINVREDAIPYLSLRKLFHINGGVSAIEKVVIVSIDGQRIGFVVDDVVGEHQTVIKSLGSIYRNLENISGATLLGDGSVALILDIQKLFREAERTESVFNHG
jgi:two-component system chemotaxis sensor kinase CheA